MLLIILVVGVSVIFFEVTGYSSKASKDEVEKLRLLINEQIVTFGNYMNSEDGAKDSLWNQLHILQDSLRLLNPHDVEPTRGGSMKEDNDDLKSLYTFN